MKKLGLILAMAFLAQGAAAERAGSSFANLAVLVAETGASTNWAAKNVTIEEQSAEKLERHVAKVNRELQLELERRFAEKMETTLATEL